MTTFYFNYCIPKNISKQDLVKKLESTLKEHNALNSRYISKGIITDDQISNISLSNGISLLDCINELKRDAKHYAFSCFNKYPINIIDRLTPKTEDVFYYNADYYLKLDNVKYDATNLAYTHHVQGVAFTLNVHNNLAKNELKIQDSKDNTILVNNLHGEVKNTAYISSFIEKDNATDNISKLIALFYGKKVDICGTFEYDFKNLRNDEQILVIEHFEKAINQKLVHPLSPDNQLVCSLVNATCVELRIFTPTAYRVYFYEDKNRLYLAAVKIKNKTKKQKLNINNANSEIIKRIKMTSNI